MRIYAIFVYLFLYVPIGIIVLFSFNAGRHASELRGLSVQWYGKALSNPFVGDAFFHQPGNCSDSRNPIQFNGHSSCTGPAAIERARPHSA